MLVNQADPRSRVKVTGKLWEWRKPQSASMYSSPSCRCPSLISHADHPRRHAADWHAGRWVISVWRQIIYDWRLLKLSIGRCPGRLKLFDAAKVRVGGMKQLQSFERHREWRDRTRDKLTIGIGFHMRTLPALPPMVCCLCIAFPRSADCSEAVCPHTAYQIVVGGHTGAADCCLSSIGYDY